MKNKTEKRNFNITVDKELVDRFLLVCKENDTTASQEIRKHMKEYLKQNAQLRFNL
jgi:hypothetical protein